MTLFSRKSQSSIDISQSFSGTRLDYKQIERLHKQILMKHISVTLCLEKHCLFKEKLTF